MSSDDSGSGDERSSGVGTATVASKQPASRGGVAGSPEVGLHPLPQLVIPVPLPSPRPADHAASPPRPPARPPSQITTPMHHVGSAVLPAPSGVGGRSAEDSNVGVSSSTPRSPRTPTAPPPASAIPAAALLRGPVRGSTLRAATAFQVQPQRPREGSSPFPQSSPTPSRSQDAVTGRLLEARARVRCLHQQALIAVQRSALGDGPASDLRDVWTHEPPEVVEDGFHALVRNRATHLLSSSFVRPSTVESLCDAYAGARAQCSRVMEDLAASRARLESGGLVTPQPPVAYGVEELCTCVQDACALFEEEAGRVHASGCGAGWDPPPDPGLHRACTMLQADVLQSRAGALATDPVRSRLQHMATCLQEGQATLMRLQAGKDLLRKEFDTLSFHILDRAAEEERLFKDLSADIDALQRKADVIAAHRQRQTQSAMIDAAAAAVADSLATTSVDGMTSSGDRPALSLESIARSIAETLPADDKLMNIRLQGAEQVLDVRRGYEAALGRAREVGATAVAAALADADNRLHEEVAAHLRYLDRQRDDLTAASVALRARLDALATRREEAVAGWYGRQVTPQQELCFLREAVRKAWAVDSAAHSLQKRAAFLRAAVRAQPFSPTLHTYLKGKAVLALARFRGAHAGWPALRWEPGSVAASHSSPPGLGPS